MFRFEMLHDEVPPQIRRLSRHEYDQMVELGMFEREKLELIRGLLVKMSPQGLGHSATIEWLTREVILQVGRAYRVRPQLPFAASDDSEPEPDIAIAPPIPTLDHPSQLLLLIEVANSSLRFERGDKLALYAEVGVPEYWIVDVQRHAIEAHSEPDGRGYARKQVYRDGDILRAQLVPELALAIAEMPREVS